MHCYCAFDQLIHRQGSAAAKGAAASTPPTSKQQHSVDGHHA